MVDSTHYYQYTEVNKILKYGVLAVVVFSFSCVEKDPPLREQMGEELYLPRISAMVDGFSRYYPDVDSLSAYNFCECFLETFYRIDKSIIDENFDVDFTQEFVNRHREKVIKRCNKYLPREQRLLK